MDMSVKGETIETPPLEQELRPDRAWICRALIEERRLVRNGFGPLCTNANWDMLLALYIADIEGCAVYQSALCLSAGIPDSSAHRWTAKLAVLGVLDRQLDDRDKRRIIVTMTNETRLALDGIMDGLSRWGQ